ncbi:hypothetical protein SDC9_195210 [bioreactor metagenome]|uniref:Uncharacterized protein n=1 Tax=bioreactor metagenome TaxID=1076179 RepID=A0A645I8D1_9ZZZZ
MLEPVTVTIHLFADRMDTARNINCSNHVAFKKSFVTDLCNRIRDAELLYPIAIGKSFTANTLETVRQIYLVRRHTTAENIIADGGDAL